MSSEYGLITSHAKKAEIEVTLISLTCLQRKLLNQKLTRIYLFDAGCRVLFSNIRVDYKSKSGAKGTVVSKFAVWVDKKTCIEVRMGSYM